MKKLFAIILSLSMLASLAACTVEPAPAPDDGGDKPVITDVALPPVKDPDKQEQPAYVAGIEIESDSGSRNISLLSEFTVKTTSPTDIDSLYGRLSMEPKMDYTLNRVSDTEYTLIPTGSLEPDTVYTLLVGDPENPDDSFAFQTQSSFIVKSILPSDKTTDVPTNTGIEVEFSEVLASDISGFFSIEPAVKGRFEMYPDGKTSVFIPEEKLAENTEYTVTVKAGLAGVSGKLTEQDYTAKFRTSCTYTYEQTELYLYLGNYYFSTYEPGQDASVYFELDYPSDKKDKSIVTDVYRYPDAESFVNAINVYEDAIGDWYYSGKSYLFPTQGLDLVLSSDSAAVETWQSAGYMSGNIVIPSLGKGIYLVNVTATCGDLTKTAQFLYQIADTQIYTESANGRTIVWIPGGNGGNADVSVSLGSFSSYWNRTEATSGSAHGKTDGDGIFMFENGDLDTGFTIAHLTNGDSVVSLNSFSTRYDRTKYFFYMYTDRDTYFQNDTVSYWGTVKNRDGSVPEYVCVRTGSSRVSKKIPVAADGTFRSSFDIESFAGYGIYMYVTDEDGNQLAFRYLSVSHADKPVYKASMSTDRDFYEYGDTVELKITSTFFDGTPAPGLSFYVYANQFCGDQTVVTDENGEATVTFVLGQYSSWGCGPAYIYCSAELLGYEDENLYLDSYFMYFFSDRLIRYETRKDDTGKYTDFYLNYYDLSNFDKSAYYMDYAGAPAEGEVSVSLEKITYIKNVYGTSYDPITKTTYENYYWDSKTENVKSEKVRFENGKLTLGHILVDDDFTGYYRYTVSYYDDRNGNTYSSTVYASYRSFESDYDSGYYPNDSYKWFTLDCNVHSAIPGESVDFFLKYGDDIITGPYLFTIWTDELSFIKVVNDGSVTVPFTEDYVGALYAYSAYYSEGEFHFSNTYVYFDYMRSNSVNVTAETDSETYRPGDSAVIKISAPEAAGGIALVSVVDEACFALGDQYLSTDGILRSYFDSGSNHVYPMFNSTYTVFGTRYPYYYDAVEEACGYEEEYDEVAEGMISPTSTKAMVANDMAETGYGSDDSGSEVTVREIFLDNPFFEIVPIGADGTGALTVTVPDNITEWRISVIATAEKSDGYNGRVFGSCVTDTVCTLPFFLNVSVADSYLTGDDISVSARGYGSDLGDTVEYTAFVEDENGTKIFENSVSLDNRSYALFAFSGNGVEFKQGTYSITVTAASNGYTDGVKYDFSVIDSGITMPVYKDVQPAAVSGLKPVLWPMNLTFHDDTYNSYLDVLSYIRWHRTSRSDSKAAFYAAVSASMKIFGDSAYASSELSSIRSELSTVRDFVSLLDYSAGDAELTAKICAVAPEVFTDEAKGVIASYAEMYISDKLYRDDRELCAALLILASLSEPVMNDLDYVYSRSGSFSSGAKLYLASAYAYLGDYATARSIYRNAVDPLLANENGYTFLKGADTEASIDLTAQALMTAVLVSRNEAVEFVRYLMDHESTVNLYVLELAAYIRYFCPPEGTESVFTYTLQGVTETKTLKPGQTFRISLSKSDFSNFSVVSADDRISVRAVYQGTVADATENNSSSDRITVSKKITPYDESRGLYLVTLDYTVRTDSNYGYYTLTDRIPSGARFFRTHSYDSMTELSGWNQWAWLSDDGQMMNGYISVYNWQDSSLEGRTERTFSGRVSYIIRAALEGTFTVDSALVQDTVSHEYAFSGAGKVTIRDGAWTVSDH